jgi:prevent-host-death family protein
MNAKSVKPISYLKAHAAEIVRALGKNGGTIVITQTGEAKAVLQDITAYEAQQDSLALLRMLAQSKESARGGQGRRLAEGFRRVRDAVKEPKKR